MYFSRVFVVVVCFVTLTTATTQVTSSTYNNLVRFANFSSAAYLSCTSVLTATVEVQISEPSTDTQGYIALDPINKQIIVVFRGSTTLTDWLFDATIFLVSYSSPIPGASCGNILTPCLAHLGFWSAWSSVAEQILDEVTDLHEANPNYGIVVTGHSLGGALTPFAALAIKGLNLGVSLQLYSYGEPRVGNPVFAAFVDAQIVTNKIFRGTHVKDVIPLLIPEGLLGIGYQHHSTEYYIDEDPSCVDYVDQCSGDEDSNCSNGQGLICPLTIDLYDEIFNIQSPHHTYFGVGMGDSCSN